MPYTTTKDADQPELLSILFFLCIDTVINISFHGPSMSMQLNAGRFFNHALVEKLLHTCRAIFILLHGSRKFFQRGSNFDHIFFI